MRLVILSLVLGALLFGERSQIYTFGPLSSTGATAGQDFQVLTPHKHTVEIKTTGTPASCSVQLEGTLENPASAGASWSNLSGAQDCTSITMFHVADRPVRAVRINVTSLSGGSTLTALYTGIQ